MNNFVQALYGDNQYIGRTGDGDNSARGATDAVRGLYTECGGTTARPSTHFWEDAEQFLDQLDAAAHGGPGSPAAQRIESAGRMIGVLHADPSHLRDAARRLVAAACCAFLRNADTAEERWQPYVGWASALTEGDSVLTFNYDRVLELMDRFVVVDPSSDRIPPFKAPQAFKLHGSVDWQRIESRGNVRYAATTTPEYALTCAGSAIGIATPGPTKRIAAHELGRLWDLALRRIEAAEVIVFVGFRFPPSDAEAREKLLGAIAANEQPHVELHVVLGPDRAHKDVVRLQQLLRYAMTKRGRDDRSRGEITESREGLELLAQQGPKQSFALTTHALFAEDFFTVWERHLLWPGIRVLDHAGAGAV